MTEVLGVPLEVATPAGVIALLVGTLIWTVRRIVTGDLVPRSTVDEIRKERDDYREIAHSLLGTAKILTNTAEATANVVRGLERAAEDT